MIYDRLPFDDHIADDTVLMRGGGVMAAFAVAGVYPDTANREVAVRLFDQLHNTVKNIAAEDVELIVYQCRGDGAIESFDRPGHRNDFAQRLSDAYWDNLARLTLYSNRLYLIVHIKAPDPRTETITQFLSGMPRSTRAAIRQRTDRLNEICNLLQTQLSGYGLRRLGYTTRGTPVIYDEIAEAIVFAMTGLYRYIPASTGRMSHAMFSEAIRFNRRQKRIEFHGAGDPIYAHIYCFKEYPVATWPGMFHELSRADFRHTLMQSFRFLSNATALSAINSKQHRMVLAGDKAFKQIGELAVAASELLDRKWVLGDHSIKLIAFADSPQRMAAVGVDAWRKLADCALVATRLTKALQGGFLSMLPDGGFWRPRPGFVKSTNFLAFSPLYNWPAGSETGHWGKPIAVFRTVAGTPYRFHWHVRDIGNCLITGSIGSGKTLTSAFLLAMTAGRARVVALDHKRGWKFLIGHLHGDYAVLGAGQPNFAPLKALDGSEGNIEFLTTLLRGCIGGTMTEEEGRRLALGLRTVMRLPPQDRCLGELRAFFDGTPEGAGARLEKWCRGNELGWVIDAPVDTVSFGRLSGLDTTALLKNERARGPAMTYLFHRISLLQDGTPLLLIMDEGWRALLDEVFRRNIMEQMRTIRSKNGMVVFITQDAGEIISSGISRVLVQQCPTQIHMGNERATKADYVDGLKLTEGQYEALAELQGGSGMFLLIQGRDSIVLQLPLHGMDEFIRVLSAREADLTEDDRNQSLEVMEAAE
jgi:type IV secretion system protein VirB4